jgi:hypothetical protein
MENKALTSQFQYPQIDQGCAWPPTHCESVYTQTTTARQLRTSILSFLLYQQFEHAILIPFSEKEGCLSVYLLCLHELYRGYRPQV